MLLLSFTVYGQTVEPEVEKAAARFKNKVITPFEQLWENGQKLDALHLFFSSFYDILYHYYIAGEVAESMKDEMNSIELKVKEAQQEYGPRKSLRILNDRIALRTAPSNRGIPVVAGMVEFPSVSLPTFPIGGLSRVSVDGKYILFDERFSQWADMEAMGLGLMTIEGKYIYRMIDRGYNAYGRFLWHPAGGMVAWHSDISEYNATLDFTSNTRVICTLTPPYNIHFYDWSLDGLDILFGDRHEIPEDNKQAPQKGISLIYRWRSGEKRFTRLAEGIDARFSPDKSHIVYVGGALQSHKILVTHNGLTSGTIFILTLSDNSSYEISRGMQPIYSPCGTRIAFVNRKGKKYHLLVYDTESKKISREALSVNAILNPAWISKEELIFNSYIPPAGEGEGTWDICWVNTLTHKTARLTSDGKSIIDTAWLHTGKEIACLNKILYIKY